MIKKLQDLIDKDPMDFLDNADKANDEEKDQDALAEGEKEQNELEERQSDE